MSHHPVTSQVTFYVNGQKVQDSKFDPKWTLLEYLRNKLGLCGTKLGCGEGGCGACTVMVSKFDRESKKIEHMSVNACLAPVLSMHGMAVTTVEGIGSTKSQLHPVQERIYKSHGSQCGFCTPGIVMSMYTLLRQKPNPPTIKEMEENFQGNLCRCTGYRPIIQGFSSLTQQGCCQMNGCCKNKKDDEDMANTFIEPNEFTPYDPSQEPIFPPELQMTSEYDEQFLQVDNGQVKWFRPTTLEQLLCLKDKYPQAKICAGNTEIGVEVKLKYMEYPVLIAPTSVPELTNVQFTKSGIIIGAAVTLTKIQKTLQNAVQNHPEHKTRIFSSILEILDLFAGPQIRNVATLGGNLITASPISDLNPIFLTSGVHLNVASTRKKRNFLLDSNFFSGYRKTQIQPHEVLLSISVPFTRKNEYFAAYKQSQRRTDDIAIVNAAFRVLLDPESNVVKESRLAYGGVAITTKLAQKTMAVIEGKTWNESLLEEACRVLSDEFSLDPSTPGGMAQYRRTLIISFFFKFYLSVCNKIQATRVPQTFKSAYARVQLDPPKASQVYQLVAPGQPSDDAIGRPIPHLSGAQQASGEAVYCDDIPLASNELHMAFVTSTQAHAKILSVDFEPALDVDGVVSYLSCNDLPGDRNWTGTAVIDEEVFASEKVTCEGQIIGAILAKDKSTAQLATRKVRVEYEPMKPLILTIKDAIKHDSFYHKEKRVIKAGDVEGQFQTCDHVLEDEMQIGGQNHFYLETQTGRAVPKGEHEELEITISSQCPNQIQMWVANALNIPANRVVVKVKRLGGGFGGKETRTSMLAIPLGVAAKKLNRPVRFSLDRDEDMLCVGGRHPYLIRYKVGFSSEGKLLALDVDIYSNGGHVLDLSAMVLETSLVKLDGAYRIPNVHIRGHLCKTNLQTNTAYRGFGAPQMIIFMETLMSEISNLLAIDPVEVRRINMYKEGDVSYYNQPIVNCNLSRCFEQCLSSCDYKFRRESCDVFNRENRWRKRGMALSPVRYGMGYPRLFLNQGCALVHIYTDGSVLLSHGGVEMGQGLHMKMIQVASRALKIPASLIHINETSTDRTPNSIQTAASFSSDLMGRAIQNACEILLERLDPIILANPKDCWQKWIRRAFKNRISLSATGFYKAPCEEYDFETNTGYPYQYYSYGCACSEVEIDCLTGDHQVLRTDIVMDVGESLNPAIDVGQIEGAFVQGYGLFTLENLRYSPLGSLLTRGPGNYKIPGFDDIPRIFNVALLKGSVNKSAVYSSKGIGEPPLLLAASVFHAIRDAILAARIEVGLNGTFRLDSPATAERIRMSCHDQFTQQTEFSQEDANKEPWEIEV